MKRINRQFMIAGVENPAFEKACRLIGSYAAVGAIFSPPLSPQAVAKWATKGVPPDRIIAVACATHFEVTPHQLNRDLYPHPDDGLPNELRGLAA